MLALFVLISLHSVAVLILGGNRSTLGLRSAQHGAATAVILSLFLVLAFFLLVEEFGSQRYGLPLVLSSSSRAAALTPG